MLLSEIVIRKIIKNIIKEEFKLEKVQVYKSKTSEGIGGNSYIKFKVDLDDKYVGLVIALDEDGVVYARKSGSKKEYLPISDPKKLITVTYAILKQFKKSGYVNNVKIKMLKRKQQAEAIIEKNERNFTIPIGDYLVTFQSIPQPDVVSKAIEIVGKINGEKDTTLAGRKLIYNNIHVPTHKKLGGSTGVNIKDGDWSGTFKKYYMNSDSPAYLGGGEHGAWSAWFLNACYILTDSDDDNQSIKKHAEIRKARGCCYPNVIATKNRNNILKNPLGYVGQKLYVIFSASELGAENNNGSLTAPNLVKGDATIVNQSAGVKSWNQIKKERKNVTGVTHMNIYLGDGKAAGGNIGNTAKNDIEDPAAGFMKLVEVVDAVKMPNIVASL